MGHTTCEPVFRLCLAESANSTMISASARSPKLLQLQGVRHPAQGLRDAVPGRSPAAPLLPGAASESPEVPCADTTQQLCQNKAAGWERQPAARARETVSQGRTLLSREQSLF